MREARKRSKVRGALAACSSIRVHSSVFPESVVPGSVKTASIVYTWKRTRIFILPGWFISGFLQECIKMSWVDCLSNHALSRLYTIVSHRNICFCLYAVLVPDNPYTKHGLHARSKSDKLSNTSVRSIATSASK